MRQEREYRTAKGLSVIRLQPAIGAVVTGVYLAKHATRHRRSGALREPGLIARHRRHGACRGARADQAPGRRICPPRIPGSLAGGGGAIAIWDNRLIMHYGVSDQTTGRYLERISVKSSSILGIADWKTALTNLQPA
jgi:hypothetical protein